MPDYSQQRLWTGVTAADTKDLREAIADGDLLDVELLPSSSLVPLTLLAAWGKEQGIEVVDDYAALLQRAANTKSKHPDAALAAAICRFATLGQTPGVAFYANAGIDDVFEAVVGRNWDAAHAAPEAPPPFHVNQD